MKPSKKSHKDFLETYINDNVLLIQLQVLK